MCIRDRPPPPSAGAERVEGVWAVRPPWAARGGIPVRYPGVASSTLRTALWSSGSTQHLDPGHRRLGSDLTAAYLNAPTLGRP
eukprot:3899587-Alexandrium_andersonii.AAC.1